MLGLPSCGRKALLHVHADILGEKNPIKESEASRPVGFDCKRELLSCVMCLLSIEVTMADICRFSMKPGADPNKEVDLHKNVSVIDEKKKKVNV